MTYKRIIAILLTVGLMLAASACGSSKDNSSDTEVSLTTSWKKGKISFVGDEFKLPKIDSSNSDGAPVIAELSKQVNPGNSLTVTGKGFSNNTKAYVFAQSTSSDGKTYEANCTFVNDTTLNVQIDSKLKYGIYAIYLKDDNGISNVAFVNRPKIWWIGLTSVRKGSKLSIYGENLTTDNKNTTHVFILSDDSYREVKVLEANPFKVTIEIPDDFESGTYYSIKLHNGHGGEYGWTEAPEKIVYQKSNVTDWEDKKINVTDFGAVPNDGIDDSSAIQQAVNSAQDGDTIYFPAGEYLCDSTVKAITYLRFVGEGSDKVKIKIGSNIKKDSSVLDIAACPTEITGITFEDIRKTEFQGNFITIKGDNVVSETYNAFIHDCKFYQSSEKVASYAKAITIQQLTSVIIENNYFESTGLLYANGASKLFINNNEFCGTGRVATCNLNCMLLWKTNMLDASGNKFYGKDLLTDDSGILQTGECTVGRTFAVQQGARNVYIADNTMERTGIPKENAGEQIMLEEITNEYYGGVSSATSDTVTLSDNLSTTPKKNDTITIVSGNGLSQWRYIKSVKGNVVTVSEPWTLVPDSTSKVLIANGFNNFVVYKNKMNGYKNYNEDFSATCGVQIYGNTHNCFITENDFSNMPYGVCVTSHYITENNRKDQNIVYWTQIDNNKISNVSKGIRYILARISTPGTGKVPMVTSLGVVIRNNEFSDITDFKFAAKKGLGGAAILLGTPNLNSNTAGETVTWNGEWQSGALIESNVFKNCEKANVLLYKHQASTVLCNNDISESVSNLYTVASGGTEPIVIK